MKMQSAAQIVMFTGILAMGLATSPAYAGADDRDAALVAFKKELRPVIKRANALLDKAASLKPRLYGYWPNRGTAEENLALCRAQMALAAANYRLQSFIAYSAEDQTETTRVSGVNLCPSRRQLGFLGAGPEPQYFVDEVRLMSQTGRLGRTLITVSMGDLIHQYLLDRNSRVIEKIVRDETVDGVAWEVAALDRHGNILGRVINEWGGQPAPEGVLSGVSAIEQGGVMALAQRQVRAHRQGGHYIHHQWIVDQGLEPQAFEATPMDRLFGRYLHRGRIVHLPQARATLELFQYKMRTCETGQRGQAGFGTIEGVVGSANCRIELGLN